VVEMGEFIKYVASRVNDYMLSRIRGEPEELYQAARHYIVAGGKRLRPAIAVAVAKMLGGSEDVVIPLAASLEILHTFTLIHDDIIDEDDVRRGVPTVHRVWGVGKAIVAGDLLHSFSYRAIVDSVERGLEPQYAIRAVRVLAEASIEICEGQIMDMNFPTMERVSIEQYIEMVSKKTGALFEASARIGAIAARAEPDIEKRVGEALRLAGIAFQIKDDILGIVGDEKVLGKPVYSDLREGKRTLPIIYALEHSNEDGRKTLLRVLGNKSASREEFELAKRVIVESGAIDYSEAVAKDYLEKALRLLDSIPAKSEEYRELLKRIAVAMVERRR